MQSDLDKISNLLNLNLIYTDSSDILLQTDMTDNTPEIKLNPIFKNSPLSVAISIVKYCLSADQSSLDNIKKYLERRDLKDYIIKAPDDSFIQSAESCLSLLKKYEKSWKVKEYIVDEIYVENHRQDPQKIQNDESVLIKNGELTELKIYVREN